MVNTSMMLYPTVNYFAVFWSINRSPEVTGAEN